MDDPKSSGPSSRQEEELEKAKALGMDDDSAAHYAGISTETLQEWLKSNPPLRLRLDRARARGFAQHLQWACEATTWSPHKDLLEARFSELFLPGTDPGTTTMNNPFRDIAAKMTEDQVARATDLLELGVQIDNQRKAAQSTSCEIDRENRLPAAPPPPSGTTTPASPPGDCAISSKQPGTLLSP